MTAQEMQYHFELKLNQFNTVDKIFTSTDVSVFLNLAQDQLVNDRYSPKEGDKITFFESDEKNRIELGSLIKSTRITSFVTADAALHPNGVFASLPSDYLYSLHEMCVIGYSDCNNNNVTGSVKVLPIIHDEYIANVNNPFGEPYKELIWRMDYGVTGSKKHELIHAIDHIITSYTLRYLRRPTPIDIINGIDCELHESVHEEIVDRAIVIALAMISQLNKNVEPKK
jgi:hypothetical protein